jgi:hypothetical protein
MMEDTMLWTISDLMHLTRDELCNMATAIEQSLLAFEPGTVNRLNAFTSLDKLSFGAVLTGCIIWPSSLRSFCAQVINVIPRCDNFARRKLFRAAGSRVKQPKLA